ncbi:threonine aspartase 1 [Aedes albopictus]|uniref:Asparaginase n=1 Tax=Aedes albopictus TaxID=7160 RepID=A0ABM1ZMQ1_AEDAL|nr:threonine aspartase 1 [Aedes albopictus]XP_029712493.1 threonine aspartase 1-like [Aedes albopictus]
MPGFVAVHTGAGNCIDETLYKNVCKEACSQGVNALKNGGSALDACELAIMTLENSCATNAGIGSNLTWNGQVECDACIMDGSTLQFGACSNVSDVKNPISLARHLCERQSKLLSFGRIPPMVLAGKGASAYAKEIGLQIVPTEHMISAKAVKSYEHYRRNIAKYEEINQMKLSPLDTVGAVCVDAEGSIVAGCSSGGLLLKVSGRVGQASTYGAGCWALTDESTCMSAATCTTGNGEYLMKTLFAKELVDDLITCNCPITSQHQTYKRKLLESPFLAKQSEIHAGSLSIIYNTTTADGDLLWAHTTNSMCLGFQSTKQKKPKFVLSKLPPNLSCGVKTVVSGHHFKLTY